METIAGGRTPLAAVALAEIEEEDRGKRLRTVPAWADKDAFYDALVPEK